MCEKSGERKLPQNTKKPHSERGTVLRHAKFNPKLFPIDYRSPIEAEGFQTYVYWISAKGTEYHLPHHRIQKGLKFRAL